MERPIQLNQNFGYYEKSCVINGSCEIVREKKERTLFKS